MRKELNKTFSSHFITKISLTLLQEVALSIFIVMILKKVIFIYSIYPLAGIKDKLIYYLKVIKIRILSVLTIQQTFSTQVSSTHVPEQ